MKLANGGWRRQGALPVIMVGACAVLAACALSGGELTQPDDTTSQTINPTETTQTTLNSTGTTQSTADPTETTQTTLDPTDTTQTTTGSAETEVTLAAPGDTLARKKVTYPVMVAAPGGFVVGEPGAENAVQLGDAKEMLGRAALSIAYNTRRLPVEDGTPCPAHRLRVSWEWPEHALGPEEGIQHGAYSPPLGPPQAGADRAAGIVYCKGSDSHYYMGFDAFWRPESRAWSMHPIPVG